MPAPASEVKKLRQQTGAGILDCKEALEASSNNFEKAVEWLRKKNLASAQKKQGRSAKEGLISSYIHGEGRIGVLLEVNSETDFVARNKEFSDFNRELSLHIAAMNPLYVSEENIPESERKKERALFKEQAQAKSKDEKIQEKVSEGLYKKWLKEVCLLNQDFVRENQEGNPTILSALNDISGKMGENIVIRRFVRFELGELAEADKEV